MLRPCVCRIQRFIHNLQALVLARDTISGGTIFDSLQQLIITDMSAEYFLFTSLISKVKPTSEMHHISPTYKHACW